PARRRSPAPRHRLGTRRWIAPALDLARAPEQSAAFGTGEGVDHESALRVSAVHASRSRRYVKGDSSELLPGLPPWGELDYGALVGVVEVVDCVPLAEVEGDPFAMGPWCWLLGQARRIRPIPFQGKVGFFDLPAWLVQSSRGTPRIDPGAFGPTDRSKDQ